MTQRDAAWLAWMAAARTRLVTMPFGDAPPAARDFFAFHYAPHAPGEFAVPRTPAMDWTPRTLRERAGHLEVEVQAGRTAAADYEIRSPEFRRRMPFAEFLDRLETGEANDTYLTANNAAANGALTALLAPDLAPLPPMLRPDPAAGYLWIGGAGVVTPTHCDLTCNVLVQYVGRKLVRLIPPSEQPRLENHAWVHSRIGWLDEGEAARRGVAFRDHLLRPGVALHIPVGWWHCVRGMDFSVMATFTSMWWPNAWTDGFPA